MAAVSKISVLFKKKMHRDTEIESISTIYKNAQTYFKKATQLSQLITSKSENCSPPCGKKVNLELGQRSK